MNRVLITPKSFPRTMTEPAELLKAAGLEPIYNTSGRTMTEDEIIEVSRQGVVGIIVGVDPISAHVLEDLPDLKAVSKYGMGTDNIDSQRAKELAIDVRVAAGTNNVSVAELAIGLLFAIARKIPLTVAEVKKGSWQRVMGNEVTGKTLGLIGAGQIGREVALRARGLCMNVIVYDPYLQDDSFFKEHHIAISSSLEGVLGVSDFVSLHVPATAATHHLINETTLSYCKPSCYLINTSRGELVDEEALYNALLNKKLAGAAQDVFSIEPPPSNHKLLELDSFILTSHTGAYTQEAVERMAVKATENLLSMLKEKQQG
ncbi:phosphoglycerate dehydrogenase [Paenibacillus paeoniae]|uniref:Phosphoglycerate dehydrogenase n=1 Tax=Paenibacillus paeoniae TaxID=2292705 RepID=A0A371P5I0_9BACL|nr:phosphoglycerate dehydrogenase [Paenibacillus paeoniae]REK71203.1 phosphoglycerate dehydrogenase [Paenibacillus paeoniae]